MSASREPSWTDAAGGQPWAALAQGMFQLPMTLMSYAVELAAATMRGALRLAEEGLAGMTGAVAEAGAAARSCGGREERQTGTRGPRVPIDPKEDRQMADTNLADEQVKLVRYTIVYIKRDEEEILDQGEILVKENMTAEGFASWRIAVYFQKPVPEKGQKPGPKQRERFDDEEDKRFLRVCHEVLCRWAREPLHYEKRQLDELKGIREAIEKNKK